MKIYAFYRNTETESHLWALTDEKSYATIFKASHLKDKFDYEVINMDKDKVGRFVNNNHSRILDWHSLDHFTRNEDGSVKDVSTIDVLMTEHESDMIKMEASMDKFIGDIVFVDPGIFKDKIFDCLLELLYPQLFMVEHAQNNNVMDKVSDYNFIHNISFDELRIYLSIYSDILDLSNVHYIIDEK